jgi:hypothetical protein
MMIPMAREHADAPDPGEIMREIRVDVRRD